MVSVQLVWESLGPSAALQSIFNVKLMGSTRTIGGTRLSSTDTTGLWRFTSAKQV